MPEQYTIYAELLAEQSVGFDPDTRLDPLPLPTLDLWTERCRECWHPAAEHIADEEHDTYGCPVPECECDSIAGLSNDELIP